MIPAWAWLMIAMTAEGLLALWLSAKTYDWGYKDGVEAMSKAWKESREKEQEHK